MRQSPPRGTSISELDGEREKSARYARDARTNLRLPDRNQDTACVTECQSNSACARTDRGVRENMASILASMGVPYQKRKTGYRITR